MKDFSIKISEIWRVKFTFSQIYLLWIKKFLPWSWGWNSGRALRVLVKWGIPQTCKTQLRFLPEGYRESQTAQLPSCSHRPQTLCTCSLWSWSYTGSWQLDVGDGTQATQTQQAPSTTAQSLQPQPILRQYHNWVITQGLMCLTSQVWWYGIFILKKWASFSKSPKCVLRSFAFESGSSNNFQTS